MRRRPPRSTLFPTRRSSVNDTATTEIYTLSLHELFDLGGRRIIRSEEHTSELQHTLISNAVFCLKKKNYSIHARGATTSRRLRAVPRVSFRERLRCAYACMSFFFKSCGHHRYFHFSPPRPNPS